MAMRHDNPSRYDFSSLNIMVVEDSEHMRRLLRAMLYAMGVDSVLECCTAVEAFEELGRFEPHIVISDWNMAPVNGVDFTRMVRRDARSANPYVPIVMVTGHAETGRVIEARDAGVNAFLAKPISMKALSERLTALIDHPVTFIRSESYFGPDRRRRNRNRGAPEGMTERRRNEIA